MKKVFLTIFSLLVFCSIRTKGQDLHFSQFDVMLVTLNPASAGVLETDYRLTNNYKIQWSSVASTPYKSYEVAYDMPLLKGKLKNNFLGVGGYVYNDVAGKSKLSTTQYNLVLSVHQKLNETNYVSAGLQGGMAYKKISIAGLRWDSQYNGEIYDPNLSSGETLASEKVNYKDFGLGGLWYYTPGEKVKIKTGASYFHINTPNKSFYGKDVNLYSKIVLNSVFSFKLAQENKLDRYLLPQVIYMRQGPHQEIYFGTFVKYVIQEPSKYTDYRSQALVSFGGFYRAGDAAVFATRIDYGPFTLGISYDFNISKLRKASSLDGGVEFSLVYANFFQTTKIKMDERMILPQL